MIIELILYPIFSLCRFLISLVPQADSLTGGVTGVFYELLSTGLYFFGVAPFILTLHAVLFWVGVDLGWISIEWLYKKIPGVS